VEDNRLNQQFVVRLLENQGHRVTVVDHGAAALTVLQEQPYDVVLMDLQMPGMDGFETTAAIRAQEGATHTHVPIIALTAHAMQGDRERCFASGMDGYVAKPIQVKELLTLLACLVADKPFASPSEAS
jgi:CheY-like chemotaxis protein